MRRWSLVVSVLVAVLALARPAAAQLAPCTDLPELPTAQCGTLAVPLDRADPGLGTTVVGFDPRHRVRRPPSDAGPVPRAQRRRAPAGPPDARRPRTAMGTLGGEPVELAFRFPAPG